MADRHKHLPTCFSPSHRCELMCSSQATYFLWAVSIFAQEEMGNHVSTWHLARLNTSAFTFWSKASQAMGNLDLLNLNSKTWESPNSVGWFFDFVATSSGSSFPKFSKKKKTRNHRKNPQFLGFFFKELEKDNLLQSRVFEKSQRTSGFPAISGKEMTVQGRFLYGFLHFFLRQVQVYQKRFFGFLEAMVKGPYTIP